MAIVGSMNLYAYSEANNREMGVLITKRKDRLAYSECMEEVRSILASSKVIKLIDEAQLSMPSPAFSNEEWNETWFAALQKCYPAFRFALSEKSITAEGFPKPGIHFSNKYGFATFEGDWDKEMGRQWREAFFQRFQEEASGYRIYWNSPYNKISVYDSGEITLKTLDEKVDYYLSGINLIANYL